jgi:sugar lactone lactonase YvrE
VPKRKRLFEVEIEAKLNVLAFDQESARKKVERALDAGRNVGADVDSAGVVWTYAATPQAEPPS